MKSGVDERSMVTDMKKWKEFFRQKILLSFIMCILLLTVLVTATTAWYASNHAADVYGMSLETGGVGGIKVALVPGGKDIMELPDKTEEGIPVIAVKLTELNNIKDNMIAPGAYGPMTFYITPLGENIKGYSMKARLKYKEEEAASDRLSEEQRKKIEKLMTEHITVYKKQKKVDGGENGIWAEFSEPIQYYTKDTAEDGTAATGTLVYNEETKAEIYWSWNYEYTDIPGNGTKDGAAAEDGMNTDDGTVAEGGTNTDDGTVADDGKTLKEKIREYDEEDTLIGNYIDHIWFELYITGETAGESDEL